MIGLRSRTAESQPQQRAMAENPRNTPSEPELIQCEKLAESVLQEGISELAISYALSVLLF